MSKNYSNLYTSEMIYMHSRYIDNIWHTWPKFNNVISSALTQWLSIGEKKKTDIILNHFICIHILSKESRYNSNSDGVLKVILHDNYNNKYYLDLRLDDFIDIMIHHEINKGTMTGNFMIYRKGNNTSYGITYFGSEKCEAHLAKINKSKDK